jgi:hypothetical protein
MRGPLGTAYRAIELAWHGFFRPVDHQKAGWSHTPPSRRARGGSRP